MLLTSLHAPFQRVRTSLLVCERLQDLVGGVHLALLTALGELGLAQRGTKCEAMEGILAEAKSIMDEIEDSDAMDAGMIASAQAVEHYEITRYGTIIAWAKHLGHDKVADLMQQNLEQEKAADAKLTKLAEGSLNQQAA